MDSGNYEPSISNVISNIETIKILPKFDDISQSTHFYVDICITTDRQPNVSRSSLHMRSYVSAFQASILPIRIFLTNIVNTPTNSEFSLDNLMKDEPYFIEGFELEQMLNGLMSERQDCKLSVGTAGEVMYKEESRYKKVQK